MALAVFFKFAKEFCRSWKNMLFLASEIMEQENGAEEITSNLKKQP